MATKKQILDSADGLVAQVYLENKDAIYKQFEDAGVDAASFKTSMIDLVTNKAKDIPSRTKILFRLQALHSKYDVLSYMTNIYLAASGLSCGSSK